MPSTGHIPSCSQAPGEPKLLLVCRAARVWHRAADGEGECRQLCMTHTQLSTNHSGNLKLHPLKPQDGRGEPPPWFALPQGLEFHNLMMKQVPVCVIQLPCSDTRAVLWNYKLF